MKRQKSRQFPWKPAAAALSALSLSVGCLGGAAAEQAPVFQDISGHWGQEYIQSAYEQGLMAGVGDGRFAPNDPCTRAEAVQTLYAMAGKPQVSAAAPFEDLTQDWYRDAISWAYSWGITAGTSETAFEPSATVTREQLAVFLYTYASYGASRNILPKILNDYPDEDQVSPWAKKTMQWAVTSGILCGRKEADGQVYLAPGETATRAELAVLLLNLRTYVEWEDHYRDGKLEVTYLQPDGSRKTIPFQLSNEELTRFQELLDSVQWTETDDVEETPVYDLYLNRTHYLFGTADGTISAEPAFNGCSYITENGIGAFGSRISEDSETVEQIYDLLLRVTTESQNVRELFTQVELDEAELCAWYEDKIPACRVIKNQAGQIYGVQYINTIGNTIGEIRLDKETGEILDAWGRDLGSFGDLEDLVHPKGSYALVFSVWKNREDGGWQVDSYSLPSLGCLSSSHFFDPEGRLIQSDSYDEEGNLLSSYRYGDFDEDGNYRLNEIYTYDEEGGVSMERRQYRDGIGTLVSYYQDGVLWRKILYPGDDAYPCIQIDYGKDSRRIEYWGEGNWDTNFGVLEVDPETGLITLVSGVDLEGTPLVDQYQVGQVYEEPPEMAG